MDSASRPLNRKAPIHYPYRKREGASSIVFLTVCTDKKKSILARPEIHDLMRKAWQEADHWLVGRYVLMPDHIHLFLRTTGI